MERFSETKKAGILGIIGNVFLLIIKTAVAFITNSQAMIADSANSASDIFASIMTYIGNKISSEPRDETHHFGHGKAEYIFSLFISISMIFLAGKILIDSLFSFVNKSSVNFSYSLVIVCVVTILVKFALFVYTNKLCKKYDNILLKANSKDHRNDCIVTTFTLLSCILSALKVYWFDAIVGIGISAWIIYTGIEIFIESFNILMDKSLDEEIQNQIIKLVKTHETVKEVASFYTVPVGYQYIVVLTICVDGNMTTFDSHSLADQLETEITKFDKIYSTTIHVNPI